MTRASQRASLADSSTSAVAKYFTPLAGGLPSGFKSRLATRTGISCVWQFSIHATCSAVSRTGNWPWSVKNLCWSSRTIQNVRIRNARLASSTYASWRCRARFDKRIVVGTGARSTLDCLCPAIECIQMMPMQLCIADLYFDKKRPAGNAKPMS